MFESSVQFCVPMEALKRKCFLSTLDEYSAMEIAHDYFYFQRASFDASRGALVPAIEEWEKICVCRMPYNPDLLTVGCDMCD